MNTLFETVYVVTAAALWGAVSLGFGLAVFSPKIRDTTWERIALAAVAITSAGNGCRVVLLGWVNEGGLFHAAAMTLLVGVLIWKHASKKPSVLPRDKSGPVPLGEMPEV